VAQSAFKSKGGIIAPFIGHWKAIFLFLREISAAPACGGDYTSRINLKKST
jgi:hypothetical protein